MQHSQSAARLLGHTLVGLGFYETVTFSFLSHKQAGTFLPDGLHVLSVDEERRNKVFWFEQRIVGCR